jgi:colanic acid/amylovoran biosynthesis protein
MKKRSSELMDLEKPARREDSSGLRVCLLGASFDNCNRGVGALADGAIRGILTCFPEAKISILDYGYEGSVYPFEENGRQLPIELINIRFSKKVYLANNIAYLLALAILLKYVMPSSLRTRVLRRNRVLRHLAEADVIGSISGGDSFSDIYGLGRLLYVSLPQILVLVLGKRLVLFPQTLGPFRGWMAQRVARYIVSRAAVVFSRDHAGVREGRKLAGKGEPENISFCYDVGFLMEPRRPAALGIKGWTSEPADSSCMVGLNVSGLLFESSHNRRNVFGLGTSYNRLIEEIIRVLIEEKHARVLLVPHVYFGPEDDAAGESDMFSCIQIYEKFQAKYPGRIGLASGRYTANELKYVIGTCDYFIGSRMHACIGALSQCIPSVAISYSDKFIGVMEAIGLPEIVADPRKMTPQDILGIVNKTFDDRARLRKHLSLAIPELRSFIFTSLNKMTSESAGRVAGSSMEHTLVQAGLGSLDDKAR